LLLDIRRALTSAAMGLALSFPLATAALAQTTDGNTDRPGGDYHNFEIAPRTNSIAGDGVVDRCREACRNDPACAAWTAVKPGVQSRNGVCWLKNRVTDKKADSCCTSGTKVTVITKSGKRPSGGTSPTRQLSAEQQQMLDLHNGRRRTCGVSALSWSWDVADSAQTWADGCHKSLSSPSSFCHQNNEKDCGKFARNPYGENLHWGPSASPQSADSGWYGEIKNYDFKNPVYTGKPKEVGHFTQMVWRASTQLGCAKKVCGEHILWVCRYNAPGNMNVVPAQPPATRPTAAEAQASLRANVSDTCK
jgi:uncharacterized protein YkwD